MPFIQKDINGHIEWEQQYALLLYNSDVELLVLEVGNQKHSTISKNTNVKKIMSLQMNFMTIRVIQKMALFEYDRRLELKIG